jgi:hypothetical protein
MDFLTSYAETVATMGLDKYPKKKVSRRVIASSRKS